ncbi:MAG: 30S ribosomal protein S4 [Bacilli bacterium]|nr:30S ribosomal protein S4 [Bacilli bacterium]
MMRYLGSDWKRSRRLGFSTLENGKETAKRPYGPGQHGADRHKKASEYGRQLIEKQKMAQLYGINERQFRRLFLIARADETVTGIAFFRILESRLDNLVYRMGFARTRRGARQLVTHGHVMVNGKKTDIPSYLCTVGDTIAIMENSRSMKVIKESLESVKTKFPTVEVDMNKMEGKYIRVPERNELPKDIDESQIIEWYNRQL